MSFSFKKMSKSQSIVKAPIHLEDTEAGRCGIACERRDDA
jgi:hypothetical protein